MALPVRCGVVGCSDTSALTSLLPPLCRFSRNTLLARQGQPGGGPFLLVQHGSVVVCRTATLPNGTQEPLNIAMLGPGDVLGLTQACAGASGVWDVSLVASSEVRVMAVSPEDWQRILGRKLLHALKADDAVRAQFHATRFADMQGKLSSFAVADDPLAVNPPGHTRRRVAASPSAPSSSPSRAAAVAAIRQPPVTRGSLAGNPLAQLFSASNGGGGGGGGGGARRRSQEGGGRAVAAAAAAKATTTSEGAGSSPSSPSAAGVSPGAAPKSRASSLASSAAAHKKAHSSARMLLAASQEELAQARAALAADERERQQHNQQAERRSSSSGGGRTASVMKHRPVQRQPRAGPIMPVMLPTPAQVRVPRVLWAAWIPGRACACVLDRRACCVACAQIRSSVAAQLHVRRLAPVHVDGPLPSPVVAKAMTMSEAAPSGPTSFHALYVHPGTSSVCHPLPC